MKLKRPRYPEVVGTATYFFIQAGHRETAVDCAIQVIRKSFEQEMAALSDDPTVAALSTPMDEWLVESLLQGAWLREYHEWEKATKAYFEGQHELNGNPKPSWKEKLTGFTQAPSHVDRIRIQLALFDAFVPSGSLDTINAHRQLVNNAKHEGQYFVTEQDYRSLIEAVASFWNELASQEQFRVM
jgi:hypothetical protein